MFGAILTATNGSFQKGMIFCRSTYVKKVMKLSYTSIFLHITLSNQHSPICMHSFSVITD